MGRAWGSVSAGHFSFVSSLLSSVPESCRMSYLSVFSLFEALADESGHFFFNGNSAIDNPQNFRVAGTIFKYRRPLSLNSDGLEYIIAHGPTNQSLNAMVCEEPGNRNIAWFPSQTCVCGWVEEARQVGAGVFPFGFMSLLSSLNNHHQTDVARKGFWESHSLKIKAILFSFPVSSSTITLMGRCLT